MTLGLLKYALPPEAALKRTLEFYAFKKVTPSCSYILRAPLILKTATVPQADWQRAPPQKTVVKSSIL